MDVPGFEERGRWRQPDEGRVLAVMFLPGEQELLSL